MASKALAMVVFAIVSISGMALLMSAVAHASETPPVYGIEIYDYERELHQAADATSVHVIRVRNTGVLELIDIELSADRLPTAIFKAGAADRKTLKFGETADIAYSLNVPDGFDGAYAFSVIATASYGAGKVSHSKPVQLIVSSGIEAAGTTTTTTAAYPIIVPGAEPARSDVYAIVGRFAELAGMPFSKLRAGVEYFRVGAASAISDATMLRAVAAALFVIVLFLMAFQKVLYGAKHRG